MTTYEERMRGNKTWGFQDASRHFELASQVFKTMRRFSNRTKAHAMSYAVGGAMALFAHGHRRFSIDVDLFIKRDDLIRVHELLVGNGYRLDEASRGSLRDELSGVRIDFYVSGEYPRGPHAEVSAFDPAAASVVIGATPYLSLPRLFDLLLARGISDPPRLLHLADVQAAIETIVLPRDLAEQLHPKVREKYVELWELAQLNPNRPSFEPSD